MPINAEWHKAHPMPKNPTLDQRIEWHLEHQQQCGCRPGLPRTIQEALAKRAQQAEGAKQS